MILNRTASEEEASLKFYELLGQFRKEHDHTPNNSMQLTALRAAADAER
jgi:hypothetical protein